MFRISYHKQRHRQTLAPFMRSDVLCSIENRLVEYSIYVFIIPISQSYNIKDNKTNILSLSYQNKITHAIIGFQIRHVLCARLQKNTKLSSSLIQRMHLLQFSFLKTFNTQLCTQLNIYSSNSTINA